MSRPSPPKKRSFTKMAENFASLSHCRKETIRRNISFAEVLKITCLIIWAKKKIGVSSTLIFKATRHRYTPALYLALEPSEK